MLTFVFKFYEWKKFGKHGRFQVIHKVFNRVPWMKSDQTQLSRVYRVFAKYSMSYTCLIDIKTGIYLHMIDFKTFRSKILLHFLDITV